MCFLEWSTSPTGFCGFLNSKLFNMYEQYIHFDKDDQGLQLKLGWPFLNDRQSHKGTYFYITFEKNCEKTQKIHQHMKKMYKHLKKLQLLLKKFNLFNVKGS